MRKKITDLGKETQIKFLTEKKIKTQIPGDILEITGKIVDVNILENEYEYFLMVKFQKGDVFNESALILYDFAYTPLAKLAYSYNEKDARISFDYFFVRKDLRGQGLGQSMLDFFIDEMYDMFGEYFLIFVNPYSFDASFNGSKSYDYVTQLHQYRLEQFYLRNGFLLTEDPKKYAFSNIEYSPNVYTLTDIPELQ